MELIRGTRDKLSKHLDPHQEIQVSMKVSGPSTYDYCCFGVDSNDKLSDDRYMVFYNQTKSPNNEIIYKSNNGEDIFNISLDKLPPSINKLVFTVSIDGNGTMGDIQSHNLSIKQNGVETIMLNLRGSDFHSEKAIISIELYRKDEWRINAIASGFNGGLGDLLRAYGGEEDTSDTPPTPHHIPPAPIQTKISLEKKIESEAPKLISLVKPLKVELEKRNLLDCKARVALVIDISGSMTERFRNGTVQEIVNKVLPIAVQFDDDGELDFWYYGSHPERRDSVNLHNYQEAVPRDWQSLMSSLGYGNNEPKVMKEVIAEYETTKIPAYVIFVTDGGVCSERDIKKLMKRSSNYPIFWQFVGVGGSNYGVLERLDDMEGRYVDNADFFALDDFKRVPNTELYSRLLNEFPTWLKQIKALGMI